MIRKYKTGSCLPTWILLIGMVSLLCSICILCLTPPVSRDALSHHLAIPKLYLNHGGIYEIPSMVFSYYPMNLDLLYLVSLYFGNDIAPKIIHFIFALLTAYFIYIYLRNRLDVTWGLLGALFFLSLPVIIKLSITVYVDLGLIFFSTGSLFILFKWIETDFKLRFLMMSAVLCGLAMGTKYNGLVTLLLLTLFVPFIYSRCSQENRYNFFRAIGYSILFLMIAALVFSPWMVRNYLWTSNPIFPLFDHWFNPQYKDSLGSVGVFNYRALVYNESWRQIALLPIRIFFQGEDGNPQYFDGRLNPLLFFLPFFAFLHFKRNSRKFQIEKMILLSFAMLFFSITFFSTGLRIRYISPIIPPLVVLSIFGANRILEIIKASTTFSTRFIWLTAFLLSVILFFGLNVSYIVKQYKYVKPFDYLFGRLSRDEYITKYRPEYPTMQYINQHLPTVDTYILFLFIGNRGYYCDRKYQFDMQLNKSMLQGIVEEADDSEYILAELKNIGITHLLMNSDIFDKWVKESFDQEGQALIQRFFSRYVKTVNSQHGYMLYTLKEAPS